MKIEEWKNAVDDENDKKAFPLQLCKRLYKSEKQFVQKRFKGLTLDSHIRDPILKRAGERFLSSSSHAGFEGGPSNGVPPRFLPQGKNRGSLKPKEDDAWTSSGRPPF
jgi:hypothetical protein